ncbi:MAG: hypothetical protein ABI847_05325 [Anaerolineales bacterium]
MTTAIRPIARPSLPPAIRRKPFVWGAFLLQGLVLLVLILATLPVVLGGSPGLTLLSNGCETGLSRAR